MPIFVLDAQVNFRVIDGILDGCLINLYLHIYKSFLKYYVVVTLQNKKRFTLFPFQLGLKKRKPPTKEFRVAVYAECTRKYKKII